MIIGKGEDVHFPITEQAAAITATFMTSPTLHFVTGLAGNGVCSFI
jgi:hypothetical protein